MVSRRGLVPALFGAAPLGCGLRLSFLRHGRRRLVAAGRRAASLRGLSLGDLGHGGHDLRRHPDAAGELVRGDLVRGQPETRRLGTRAAARVGLRQLPDGVGVASQATGSRRATSGHPRASTSNARNRHVCAAAASSSPSPVTTTLVPSWVTSTSARRQSASTQKTVRSCPASPWAASAAARKGFPERSARRQRPRPEHLDDYLVARHSRPLSPPLPRSDASGRIGGKVWHARVGR